MYIFLVLHVQPNIRSMCPLYRRMWSCLLILKISIAKIFGIFIFVWIQYGCDHHMSTSYLDISAKLSFNIWYDMQIVCLTCPSYVVLHLNTCSFKILFFGPHIHFNIWPVYHLYDPYVSSRVNINFLLLDIFNSNLSVHQVNA